MRLGDGGRLRPHVGQMQVDGLGGPVGDLQEPPAILHPFQVNINGGGARVLQEVFQDLVFGHIEFIAQTQKLIEAQAFFGHPGQHMGGHPAALGNDGDAARPGKGLHLGKGQGQAEFQVDQAQAIGTYQTHAVLFKGGPHFRFQGQSRLVQLRETGRFHHDSGNPQLAAFPHQGGHDPGRRQDDRQVHRLGKVGQPREDRQAEGGTGPASHQEDLPLVLEVQHIGDNSLGQVGRVVGDSHHGHTARIEEFLHIPPK